VNQDSDQKLESELRIVFSALQTYKLRLQKVDVVAPPAGTRFASFPTDDRLVVRTHMEDL